MRTKDGERLAQIQGFVEDFCDRNGYGPSVREIADEVGMTSSSAQRYLAALAGEGRISKAKNGYVSKALARTDAAMCSIPILGIVSCGPLTEAEELVEGYLRLPESLVGKGKFYLLTANGDSMIGAGIEDGDLVLIRQQETAEVGDIIVALVENEVTLKRLAVNTDTNRYYLHPENPMLDDIYVNQLMVQGVAVKVFKDLK